MVDDARIGAGSAAYRGFLFSDLRGFTAFAERHGNSAAAAMVARFLDLARTAIARHDCSEVSTEGDAIHAVFPSASSAVLCGLEIVDSAAELNAQEPDRPIGLGVGVHAGEAVPTAEGYIGSAVNLAARLCAAARPGEVLVTSTVKGITQASIPVGFIARGRRRLKGIREPVEIYAVTRSTAAKPGRIAVPRRAVMGGAGVALAALVVVALVAASQLLTQPGATPAPSTAAVGQPVVIGRLPISTTYRSQQFQPPFTFDIVDPGWTANRDAPGMFALIRDAAPRGGLQFLRVDKVIDTPCGDDGTEVPNGPSAADLLTQLQALTGHLTVSEPETVRIGGAIGRQVDVTVLDSAQAACGGLAGGGGVAIFRAAGETWEAASGERFRLISLDVNRQAVTIIMSTDWTQTRSVQELEAVLALGQNVLNSVRF
jgi:class 3 adenylate cyclase